jgi:hypothetical protein
MQVPIVRVEVDGLKQMMLAQLSRYSDEVEQAVNASLSEKLQSVDIGAIADRETGPAIERMVEDAIRTAVGQLQYDKQFRKALLTLVRNAALATIDAGEETE